MCVEYRNIKSNARMVANFGVELPGVTFEEDLFPLYLGPLVRLAHRDRTMRECVAANFGLIPPFAEDKKAARHRYNARSETVASKPSYRNAWRKAQFGIVPMDHFYEPSWETGQAVRWKIGSANGDPLGVACIWEWSPRFGAGEILSYSMLTMNADQHALMQRFHRPGDEKRSLIILPPSKYEAWLHTTAEEAPDFFVPYPAELMGSESAPRPVKARPPVPIPRPKQPDLAL